MQELLKWKLCDYSLCYHLQSSRGWGSF